MTRNLVIPDSRFTFAADPLFAPAKTKRPKRMGAPAELAAL